jgi:hypothetical protein
MSHLRKHTISYFVLALAAGIIMASASFMWSQAPQGSDLPRVELSADNLGPRPIEDLTRKSVSRDYAYAWKTMTQALVENRTDLLNGYFTGFAKDNLAKMIADQRQTGVRVQYTDLGHKLDALFYSPAGDAMQLRDQAKLEIQVLDGDKVIDRQQVNMQYMVLMTPGADRWLVRDLESTPEVPR